MEKHIFIVRHGETELNRRKIIQGSGVDAPLNATGRKQAHLFFEKYREEPFEGVITSALQRTHQTMAPFIEAGLSWEQTPDINEMSWGRHEGKGSTPELHERYRAMIDAWQRGDLDARLDDGESLREMADRLNRFIERLRQRPEQYLLVCSHGRAMRALMCLLKQQDLKMMEKYRHSNTGLYRTLYRNDYFHFLLENDTSHLEGVQLS